MADDAVFGVFVLGMGLAVAATCVAVYRRRWARLYWIASTLVVFLGGIGMAYVTVDPPQYFDAEGHLIGEMPPEFVGAALVVSLGCAMLATGVLVRLAGYAFGWAMRRRRP